MKNSLYTILIFLLFSTSCQKDFLDRSPQDAINENSFFKNSGDLKSYMTGVFGTILRGDSRWNGLANGSDDFIAANPHGSLTLRNNSGIAQETNSTWNDNYTRIRNVNYFLENAYRVSELNPAARHYIGEGYFCRAYYYFTLLNVFGDVPIILKPLNPDSEELYKSRNNRNLVARQILVDLDSAILNLQWKGEGEASPGRLNKQSALVFKTRVGLFEGTWEFYHGQKSTPFGVEGENGTFFLEETVSAAEMLIEKEGESIYRDTDEPYKNLFVQNSYSNIPGAYLYREYHRSLSRTHNWNGGGVEGWDGLSHDAVTEYLMKDGKPQEISEVPFDITSLNSIIDNKDPRLYQTIWQPKRGTFYDYFGGAASEATHHYRVNMPGFIIAQQRVPSQTGYRIIKGIPLDPSEWRNGESDDLIIRYAEALLNFAEAKAILGTITQSDLDRSINVLRNRIQMTPMILADINSWNISYDPKKGYDVTSANIVNEIRRERRVELMLEGFRDDDLRRWALKEVVFNNHKPKGAHLEQFLDFWNSSDSLAKYGFQWSTPDEVRLVKGVDIDCFEDGFINPYWRNADFNSSGQGYYIDPNRDYLSAIPSQEIEVYQLKGNVTLTQNPGWIN